jgi:hypothetical protein
MVDTFVHYPPRVVGDGKMHFVAYWDETIFVSIADNEYAICGANQFNQPFAGDLKAVFARAATKALTLAVGLAIYTNATGALLTFVPLAEVKLAVTTDSATYIAKLEFSGKGMPNFVFDDGTYTVRVLPALINKTAGAVAADGVKVLATFSIK